MSFQPCRRQALGIGAGIAAAGFLAACSGSETEVAGGEVLADVADVPEGQPTPVLIGEAPVILTQDAPGSYRAFLAICTHQGCKVVPDAAPEILVCPCHRSEFNTFTGEVLRGPATEALTEIPIEVVGGQIIAR